MKTRLKNIRNYRYAVVTYEYCDSEGEIVGVTNSAKTAQKWAEEFDETNSYTAVTIEEVKSIKIK